MNPLVFWNELAERPLAQDEREARQRMDGLVDALAALRRAHPSSAAPRIRTSVPLHGVYLSENYTIAKWSIDAERTRRLFFLQLATSAPLLREPDDPTDAVHRYGCSECWYCGESGRGLRAAWAADELSISLESHERWKRPLLEVELDVLDEDRAIERQPGVVRHVSTAAHVEMHRQWLETRAKQSVADGRDLWARRKALLPHLVFCKEVQKQLARLDGGSPELRSVTSRLFELNERFARWDGRPIHPDFLPSKCTPETPHTLREEVDTHTATLPDGMTLVFSWHVRFTPRGGRIFFDGDSISRTGIVGYVGIKKDGKLT